LTSGLCREIRWWREQQLLQMGLVQIRWQRPAQTGLNRAAQVFAHGGAADATGRRNLAVAQPSLPLEAKNFFDLAFNAATHLLKSEGTPTRPTGW